MPWRRTWCRRPANRFRAHTCPLTCIQRAFVRQHVEHAAAREGGPDDLLVERRRHVDAAVGDPVVIRRWRGQTLGALFLRHAGRGRVDRDRGVVVDPQHAAGIDGRTVAADEAARRGGAVAAGDLAQGEARDAGGGVVAHGGAEQAGRGAAQAAIAAEHEDLGGGLVHDREGIALAVAGGDDPAGQFDHRVGDVLAAGQFVQ